MRITSVWVISIALRSVARDNTSALSSSHKNMPPKLKEKVFKTGTGPRHFILLSVQHTPISTFSRLGLHVRLRLGSWLGLVL